MGSHIQTFVALDIETTGLPHQEYRRTRLTEMSLIAISREHISEAHNASIALPRVLQKLNVCVNPCKMIQPQSSAITGLSNDLLEKEQPFNETLADLLSGFLSRLNQPVCLVAHNGMKFDFPILQSELNRCNKAFPNNILFVDTLLGFKVLLEDGIVHPNADKWCEQHNEEINGNRKSSPKMEVYGRNESDNLLLVDEGVKVPVIQTAVTNDTSVNSALLPKESPFSNMQKVNETTPKCKPAPSSLPNSFCNLVKRDVTNMKCARKRLILLGDKEGDFIRHPKSFKLIDIYEFLCHRPAINSHQAESDNIQLLECIVKLGHKFIDWADANATNFNNIRRLW